MVACRGAAVTNANTLKRRWVNAQTQVGEKRSGIEDEEMAYAIIPFKGLGKCI